MAMKLVVPEQIKRNAEKGVADLESQVERARGERTAARELNQLEGRLDVAPLYLDLLNEG
jgi:hypothetical protein